MKIYNILDKIVFYKNGIITINICDNTEFLDIFSLIELFNYIIEKYSSEIINEINIGGNCEIKKYLDRINFLHNLNAIFGIAHTNDESIYTGNNALLQEILLFSNKNEFYVINEKILNILGKIGLSDDTSYLVLSSLGEIIDNTFFHNLGRWNTVFGPKCIFLIQNYPKIRKLSFVISDLGVGFSNTLKDNYPGLNIEKDYIEIALKPGITGRYQNKGGNGLVYLQKNIFNGFKGELYIRSNNTLVKVESLGKTILISDKIDLKGVNINFSLFY